MSEYIYVSNGEPLANEHGEISLARAGEVVRCKDCRFYKCGDDGWWCLRSISAKSNHPNGFCAWAERKK